MMYELGLSHQNNSGVRHVIFQFLKISSIKFSYISPICFHATLSDSDVLTRHVCMASMLMLIGVERYQDGVPSNGMMSVTIIKKFDIVLSGTNYRTVIPRYKSSAALR